MKDIIEKLSNAEFNCTGGFAIFTITLWIAFILDTIVRIIKWVIK